MPEPDPREEARAFKPWWRRAWDWLNDAHKFLLTFGGICAATLAGHAWLKGLITRRELDLAVEVAVRQALAPALADLTTIKTNTAGLPDWRGDVTVRLAKVETDITHDHEAIVRVQIQLDHQFVIRGH
jgi:hypothetical protein